MQKDKQAVTARLNPSLTAAHTHMHTHTQTTYTNIANINHVNKT